MSLYFTEIYHFICSFWILAYFFYLPTLRKTWRFPYPEIESCLILKKYLTMLGHCKIMRIYSEMVYKMSYVPSNAEKCMGNVKKNKKRSAYKPLSCSIEKCFIYSWWSAHSICYTDPIVVLFHKRFFWNHWIINVGGVSQHDQEPYSKLYFFFRFNDPHFSYNIDQRVHIFVTCVRCICCWLMPFKSHIPEGHYNQPIWPLIYMCKTIQWLERVAIRPFFCPTAYCFIFSWWLAYCICYTEPIKVMLHKHSFWNNWIIKVGGVNQHEPGESYSKLCFFFRFNASHIFFPL